MVDKTPGGDKNYVLPSQSVVMTAHVWVYQQPYLLLCSPSPLLT